MATCAGAFYAEGMSDILPGSECAGFEFHQFSVECDISETACMRKFLNDSTARDAFEA